MTINKGDKVKVHYTGTLEDNTVFDSSEEREPLEFEVGSGQLIKGFDEAVVGMEKGEEKVVKIKPEDGYGESNQQLIKKIPRKNLPPSPDPKPGMMLGLTLADGQQMPAKITAVDSEFVTIDLNHPLAGKNLTFKIKILDVA